VSGISSGGAMAVQSQIAFSDRIGGAGVIAAPPYHCAAGNIATALSACMTGEGLSTAPLVAFTEDRAGAGDIAALEFLSASRFWVLHSPADSVVAPAVGRALADYYATFVPPGAVVTVTDVKAAHGWPALNASQDCNVFGGDFLVDCGYDAAGAILGHLYGELSSRSAQPVGKLQELDVSGLFAPDSGVEPTALAYVPPTCADVLPHCRLHIAFHGCQQGREFVGDRFARGAGLNEWAAANAIVVVYPQIAKSAANPLGCWDWWGYTGADYDLRSGKQTGGVGLLIDAFESGALLRPVEK